MAKKRKVLKLTDVEKLDGQFPGLAYEVKSGFDQGLTAAKVAECISKRFPVQVTKRKIQSYRSKRWVPDKKKLEEAALAAQAAVGAFGGDKGLDNVLSARLFEVIQEVRDWKQLSQVRAVLCKTRAQSLKEQEFLFKTGQLKQGKASGEGEEDAAANEAKTKRVMNKIRAIFGLEPLPDETSNQQPEAGSEASPVEVEPSGIEPSGGRAIVPLEEQVSPDEPASAVKENG